MKRAIIGGFVSLIGSIWALANLMPWFAVSIILVLLGMILMAVEFFRKDK